MFACVTLKVLTIVLVIFIQGIQISAWIIIARFVSDMSNSVVLSVNIDDVLSGSGKMPFINSSAWRSA